MSVRNGEKAIQLSCELRVNSELDALDFKGAFIDGVHVLRRATELRLAAACVVAFAVVSQQTCVGIAQEINGTVLEEFPILCDPMLTVPVTFGHNTYTFHVDTGCTNSNFSPRLSHLLTPTSRRRRFRNNLNSVVAPVYSSPEGKIGELRLPRLDEVSCFEETVNRVAPMKVDGCLGMDVLSAFIMRVDYERRKVSFLSSIPPNVGVQIPLNPSFGSPSISAQVDEKTLAFTLDTGCYLYCAGGMTTREFEGLTTRGKLSLVEKVLSWSAVELGEHRAGVVRVPLMVGGFRHSGLAFAEISNSEIAENLLGSSYLRRYVVTFDFPHHAVYLAPGAFYNRIDASHNPGGVWLSRDGKQIAVREIAMPSPVAAAGVRVNDVLTEINGNDTSTLGDDAIAILISRSDRPTSMIFKRTSDGSSRRVVHDEGALRKQVLEQAKTHLQQTIPPSQKPSAGGRIIDGLKRLKRMP